MNLCRVCGSDKAKYSILRLQYICDKCKKTTPKKVGRESFDRYYWDGKQDQVPASTRRDFYEDYLTSDCTLEAYKKATTTNIEE